MIRLFVKWFSKIYHIRFNAKTSFSNTEKVAMMDNETNYPFF